MRVKSSLMVAFAALLALSAAVAMPSAEGSISDSVATCDNLFTVSPVAAPAGVDPVTATADQLEAAGLPPKPSDVDDPNYASDLSTWQSFVSHPIRSWSCSDLTASPMDQDSTPTAATADPVAPATRAASTAGVEPAGSAAAEFWNWAGYQATSHPYRSAEGTWHVPSTETDPAHGGAKYTQWVGLGDGVSHSDPLVQAGTENTGDDTGSVSPTFWWEVYCACTDGNGVQVKGYVTAGDSMYVHAAASGTTDTMTVDDETSGAGGVFTYTKMPSNFADTAVEWIGERTSAGGSYYTLAKTAVPPNSFDTMYSAKAAYGSGAVDLSSLPYYPINMYTCPTSTEGEHLLMLTSASPTSATSFNLKWYSYGVPQTVSTCPG